VLLSKRDLVLSKLQGVVQVVIVQRVDLVLDARSAAVAAYTRVIATGGQQAEAVTVANAAYVVIQTQ